MNKQLNIKEVLVNAYKSFFLTTFIIVSDSKILFSSNV